MRVSASMCICAPRDRVFALYADYVNWNRLFSLTIKGVRLVRDEGNTKELEIDHVDGLVPNMMRLRPPDTIEVDEVKRRYIATFLNTFEAVPDGTRFTVAADVRLKGWYTLATPFVRGYVHRQIVRFVLEPMKQNAERAH